jgi:hypothetical protein
LFLRQHLKNKLGFAFKELGDDENKNNSPNFEKQ